MPLLQQFMPERMVLAMLQRGNVAGRLRKLRDDVMNLPSGIEIDNFVLALPV